MLNRSDKVDIYILFLILGEGIQFFTNKYDTNCWFFIVAFSHLEEIYFVPNLLRDVVKNGFWIFSNAFSMSVEIFICFPFVKSLLNLLG